MINQIIRLTLFLIFVFTYAKGELKVRAPKELIKRLSK